MQAVVGGGFSGIIAARELLQEGHTVAVFEQDGSIGGVWVLTDSVESDPLGQAAARTRVHSSMYDSLRTNLPREIMGHPDVPFMPAFMNVRRLLCLLPSALNCKMVSAAIRLHWPRKITALQTRSPAIVARGQQVVCASTHSHAFLRHHYRLLSQECRVHHDS